MGIWESLGYPKTLDGLFHGKSHLVMDDDWRYPHDSGNHHKNYPSSSPMTLTSIGVAGIAGIAGFRRFRRFGGGRRVAGYILARRKWGDPDLELIDDSDI